MFKKVMFFSMLCFSLILVGCEKEVTPEAVVTVTPVEPAFFETSLDLFELLKQEELIDSLANFTNLETKDITIMMGAGHKDGNNSLYTDLSISIGVPKAKELDLVSVEDFLQKELQSIFADHNIKYVEEIIQLKVQEY